MHCVLQLWVMYLCLMLFLCTWCTSHVHAGPSLMPGGSPEAYKHIQDIVEKVAAQVSGRGGRDVTSIVCLRSVMCSTGISARASHYLSWTFLHASRTSPPSEQSGT
jgi:hypothetical protein